ncbi:MAG: LacI family DNA-binding transcriptional regulator [Alphaproteobacteria bacterium]
MTGPLPRNITSQDVARRAGVSHMTVSRVFRHPDKVTKKTRDLVESVALELGYVPSKVASGFKSDRTDLVAIVVPSIENSLFAPTINGLAEALKPLGCDVVVSAYGNDTEFEEQVVQKLLSRRPVGLVLHGTHHSKKCESLLRSAKTPLIEVGDLIETPIDHVISFSNFDAAKAMTTHLIGVGYRKIALVGLDPRNNDRARLRLEGYKSALLEAGLDFDPAFVKAATPGFEAGATAVREIVESSQGVDAVFCSGDVHAIGALLECKKRGWRVPKDIAIAGFDDHEIATHLDPALTTLSLPRMEIGTLAGQLIARYLASEELEPTSMDVGFSILERDST